MRINAFFAAGILGSLYLTPSHALEASAGATGQSDLSSLSMHAQVMQDALTTALQTHIAALLACTNQGKLYAPGHPDRDANGCLAISMADNLPPADVCGSGAAIMSNGTHWGCQRTISNITTSCDTVACDVDLPTLQKVCDLNGFSSVESYTQTGGGCKSCWRARWTGSAWNRWKNDNAPTINSLICFKNAT